MKPPRAAAGNAYKTYLFAFDPSALIYEGKRNERVIPVLMSYPSDISSMVNAGVSLILAYGDGGFRISNQRHEGSILLLPGLDVMPWPVEKISQLTAKSLEPVVAASEDVDILLLGCGPGLVPVKPAIRKRFAARQVSIEPMDTGAACRTFNVLAAEERRVAAALIAVT